MAFAQVQMAMLNGSDSSTVRHCVYFVADRAGTVVVGGCPAVSLVDSLWQLRVQRTIDPIRIVSMRNS